MRPENVAVRREYHARRSAQEKAAADAARSHDVAQRHLALHRLHELECIDLCSAHAADQPFSRRAPKVKSAPHRVIMEAPEERVIEFSPEQAIAVAELIIEKAAEACGDGMLVDEMTARKKPSADGGDANGLTQ